jgi:hypothetical protein
LQLYDNLSNDMLDPKVKQEESVHDSYDHHDQTLSQKNEAKIHEMLSKP